MACLSACARPALLDRLPCKAAAPAEGEDYIDSSSSVRGCRHDNEFTFQLLMGDDDFKSIQAKAPSELQAAAHPAPSAVGGTRCTATHVALSARNLRHNLSAVKTGAVVKGPHPVGRRQLGPLGAMFEQ